MARKFELIATGNGFWVQDGLTGVKTQVINERGEWVGPDVTSTSVSSSPSNSVSKSASTSPSTSVSSSRSTSVSSSVSASPSAS
jgi:hypothetical protein